MMERRTEEIRAQMNGDAVPPWPDPYRGFSSVLE
jgi:hypothetical protein